MEQCPFCRPEADPLQHVVLETTHCRLLRHDGEQAVLRGSCVIVPKAHRESPFELTKQEWTELHVLLRQAKAHLDRELRPAGYTLGWNVGPVSHQTIPHAHLHVIPRYSDEPYAGRGLRHWLKQPENRRPKEVPSCGSGR